MGFQTRGFCLPEKGSARAATCGRHGEKQDDHSPHIGAALEAVGCPWNDNKKKQYKDLQDQANHAAASRDPELLPRGAECTG